MEQQELFPLTPIAEKQIFSNYEVHDKKRMPIILSLIGISVILHSVILAGAVLTPGVRDLFYLGALFNDARNSKMVSKPYKDTEIGDSVTFIDPNTIYQYPEGYFSKLDPNDPNVQAMPDKYTDTNSPVDLGGFNPTNPTRAWGMSRRMECSIPRPARSTGTRITSRLSWIPFARASGVATDTRRV